MASTAARRGGGGGGQEEEEEHHRNPFLSTISSTKPYCSKLQFRKEVSVARWDEELGMGEVVEKKGSSGRPPGSLETASFIATLKRSCFWLNEERCFSQILMKRFLAWKIFYTKIASRMVGCSWESFEAHRHLKSLGYIVGRHGTSWTMKSGTSCCSSNSLQDMSERNGRSKHEVEEEISTMLKDMQIAEMMLAFDVDCPTAPLENLLQVILAS